MNKGWTVLAKAKKQAGVGGVEKDFVCFLSVSYFDLLLLSFVEEVARSGSIQIFFSLFSIDMFQ